MERKRTKLGGCMKKEMWIEGMKSRRWKHDMITTSKGANDFEESFVSGSCDFPTI